MGSINSGPGSKWLGSKSSKGDDWLHDHVNEIKDALRRGRISVASPLELRDTPSGSLLRVAIPTPVVGAIGKTGAGGVPAMASVTPGSAGVRIWTFNGTTLSDSGVDVTAFNTTATAVGPNKFIQMKFIGAYYFVDVESC